MIKKLREFFAKRAGNQTYWRLVMNIVISFVFFGLYTYFLAFTSLPVINSALFLGAAYVVSIIISGMLYRFLSVHIASSPDEDTDSVMGNMTLDLMIKLDSPVALCDQNGVIVWQNRCMKRLNGTGESLYGKNIVRLCGATLDVLDNASECTQQGSGEGIDIIVFDGYYRVRSYKTGANHKNMSVVVMQNRTELHRTLQLLDDENPIVAYIVIDNLEELMQYVQDKYRDASSDIAAILKNWAAESGGIIKEYERDKFIFIFAQKHLDTFTQNKFEVLDRIRDIRVGEGNLPITVSIGISNVGGTFADKERASHAALDMALQRGGDQVVVKNDSGMEFYGGRTKSVQKRTKVRARVVANELLMLMSRSSNVLVMCHKYADFDAIGACAGAARLAMFCGVNVNIIANLRDPNLEKCFSKLHRLAEYNDVFIDPAAAQDLIRTDTLLVICDVNNRTQLESTDIADNAHTIAYVDHHRKTAEFAVNPAMTYIEPSASSTCELMAEILEQTLPAGYLSRDEAELMLAGILLDTKQFARNTGVRTFSAALYLRGEGANTMEAQALFRTNLDDFMREAKFETNVTIYRGHIAIALNDSPLTSPADRIAAAKSADKLLSVDGVTASFALCRIENTVHISARSVGTFNVQLVLEKMGGGGHYDAAATQVKNSSMSDALNNLKLAIDQYIGELNS